MASEDAGQRLEAELGRPSHVMKRGQGRSSVRRCARPSLAKRRPRPRPQPVSAALCLGGGSVVGGEASGQWRRGPCGARSTPTRCSTRLHGCGELLLLAVLICTADTRQRRRRMGNGEGEERWGWRSQENRGRGEERGRGSRGRRRLGLLLTAWSWFSSGTHDSSRALL
ncbi:hypothetical protein TRIUR3_05924 [Triticum urartu]|uniref:Uncharacterized protein n=1 Tax=Triticum urartu TaxID=4572 RepID=M7ZC72_TRIUA|nr:hypothetical protein TRIUR3_05924 [Triticum urartu]